MSSFVLVITLIIAVIIGGFLAVVGFFAVMEMADKAHSHSGQFFGGLAAMIIPAGMTFLLSLALRRSAPNASLGLKIAAIMIFILSVPCDGMLMVSAFVK